MTSAQLDQDSPPLEQLLATRDSLLSVVAA